jgi:hypothetical protein
MSVFQWLALSTLGLVLAWELVNLRRGSASRGFCLLRVCLWAAAAVAIAFPLLVQDVALMIGIGRGADVLLYTMVLTFLATTFYFYSRSVKQQRQLTEVVRHIALQEAKLGELPGDE